MGYLRSTLGILHEHKDDLIEYFSKKRSFMFELKDTADNLNLKYNIEDRINKRDTFVNERISQLYLLSCTLHRLIEDFKLESRGIKSLVYVVDSTEFQGYVDPYEHIWKYIFRIDKDKYDKKHLLEKAMERKYRLEVLFGKKQVKTKNVLDNIIHPAHIYEIFAYKSFLMKGILKNNISDELTKFFEGYRPTGKSNEEKAEKFIKKIKNSEHRFINVFILKFTEQLNKLQRFKDIFEGGVVVEPKDFKWNYIVEEDEGLEQILREIDYDERLYNFFYEVLSVFNIGRNSSDALKIDCKALAYVCTVNIYLKENNIAYRTSMLSSSRVLNIFSKSIIDFFENTVQMGNRIANDFRDIIYVRYPTLLINQIKHTWKGGGDNKNHNDFCRLVGDYFKELNRSSDYLEGAALKEQDHKKLSEIKDQWIELRQNLMLAENIEDVQERESGDSNLTKKDKRLFDSLNTIGFDNLYSTVRNLNEEIIDEVLKNYLVINAESLCHNFKAKILSIEKDGLGEKRYLLSSSKKGTCQNVFQIPEGFFKAQLLTKTAENHIYSFDAKKLKSIKSDNYLLLYLRILCSALLRDWTIVEIVTRRYLKEYSDVPANTHLLEEVNYLNHLANRHGLYTFKSVTKLKYSEDGLDHELNYIDNLLEEAIKLNGKNPRLKLCKTIFIFEKAVFRVASHSEGISSFEVALEKVDDFKSFYQAEYLEQSFYKNNGNFEDYPFRNNLLSMYYKTLLTFYIYSKTTFSELGALPLEKLEQQARVYCEELRKIVAAEKEKDSDYLEMRLLTNYILLLSQQLISGKYHHERLQEASSHLKKATFFGRFILGSSLKYIKDRQSGSRNLRDYETR